MKRFNIAVILLTFLAIYFFYPLLPEQMPMHWNLQGQIDNYIPKNIAVWLLPLTTLVIFILMQALPFIDPKKEKYNLFAKEWDIIKTGFVLFMTYLQFVVFYIAIHPQIQMMPLMFIGLGAIFILIGNYLSKIRQNFFIGIKLPWTLADEDNWNKTHRFASWCFVIAGIVTLAEAYFIWYAPIIIYGCMGIAILLPTIYSFLLYKGMAGKMKYVYLFLAVIILLVLSVRLASGEDDWICKDGQWVKHGQPSSPAPSGQCR